MKTELFVVQGRPRGKHLPFAHGEYILGRGPECHIRIHSDWVSRQHGLLRVTPEAVFLRDLASRNGTLVNGVRLVGECQLQLGDQVQVGPVVLELRWEGAPPAPGTA
jgi:pSer/pThr/pTyr-binding forkhead associated (FHA) protein